jgi:hypothetical protein
MCNFRIAPNPNYGLNRHLLNPPPPEQGEKVKFVDCGDGRVEAAFRNVRAGPCLLAELLVLVVHVLLPSRSPLLHSAPHTAMNGQGQCRTGVRTGEMTSALSAPVIHSVTGDSAQRACIAESTPPLPQSCSQKKIKMLGKGKRKKMHVSREDFFPYSSVLFVFFRSRMLQCAIQRSRTCATHERKD